MPRSSVADTTILYGLTRSKQNKIQWLNATVDLGTPGQFTEINLAGSGYTTTIAGNRLTITFSGGSGSQAGIQWQDEGIALGTSGTVDTVNFVGSAVAATRVGNVVTCTVTAGTGTVTSVALSMPAIFTVSGSPVTTTGTLTATLANQSANTVWAGPTTGAAAAPTFRALVVADLPPIAKASRGPGCIFTNGGLLLSGTLTSEIEIPYAFNGTGWTIAGDVAGSASIVVSHATYANYDTMTTTLTATCTTAKKNQATGLSYSFAAGDVVRFSGSGFSGFTRVSIALDGTPA